MSALRVFDLITAFNRFFDGLVHASVADSLVERHRHHSFIATNLVGGMAVFVAVPLIWVFVGPMDLLSAGSLIWLVAPAPIALMVSQTGRLDHGHVALALVSAALFSWVALFTGGIGSFALIWVAVIPIEAALSGSRIVARSGFAIAVGTVAAIAAASSFNMLPNFTLDAGYSKQTIWAISTFGVVYMTMLALRMEGQFRSSELSSSQRHARYRLVAENVGDVIATHAENADILYISPGVDRLIGITQSEARADGLFRRVHVADRPAYLTTLSDAVQRRRVSTTEFRVKTESTGGNPHYVWLEMRCRPLPDGDPNEQDARVVCLLRDVTERKQQEAQLLRAREAAELASHAKMRFLANVSHELRTPLNAIIGFSDLLNGEIFGKLPEERQREYVSLIHESGSHLLQVVNDILDISKIESGNFDIIPEAFDVAQLLNGLRQLMSHQAAAAGLKIITSVAPRMPELVADRRACKQIFINLLSNSIKFSEFGGTITIGAQREGSLIALYVRDSGIGIAEKDIGRLGTPFVQADSGYDRRHEGTGLGLSVVKGLALLHGGSMLIESRLGSGTCVTVRLPILPDPQLIDRLPGRGGDAEVVPLATTTVTENGRLQKSA